MRSSLVKYDLPRGRGEFDILMYHSISEGPGPLSIPPLTFRMQMETLADCGFRCVSLRDHLSADRHAPGKWGARSADPTARAAVVTFDDGYVDFMEFVVPELNRRGWTCTLFVAPRLIEAREPWNPDGSAARHLMTWRDIQRAAACGIEIGSHGLSHVDLTELPPEAARAEIEDSQQILEERVQQTIISFAPPFGRSTPAIRAEIARHYGCSVGTTMARASGGDDIFDLPRIEMWYFRDRHRWQQYAREGPTPYFHARRFLRAVRRGLRI